jgi:AcrR family transcriptional regulator
MTGFIAFKKMRKSTHATIRAALRKEPDGLSISQVAQVTGLARASVRQALPNMPDVYVDRWEQIAKTKGYEGKSWRAIYISVAVPPSTPRPSLFPHLRRLDLDE